MCLFDERSESEFRIAAEKLCEICKEKTDKRPQCPKEKQVGRSGSGRPDLNCKKTVRLKTYGACHISNDDFENERVKKMRAIFRTVAAILTVLLLTASCFAAVLIPGGEAVGLELTLSTLCVTKTEEGKPAQQAGLRAGDRIETVDQKKITKLRELSDAISAGRPLIIGIRRDGKGMTFTVRPEKTEAGWRIGAEVTDCISGIGTITYFNMENNTYGTLGHGVDLPDTAGDLAVSGGTVCTASVDSVKKSESGTPGELKGKAQPQPIGTVTQNTQSGVFGTLCEQPERKNAVPVATASQVHPGDAVIRCCVSGTTVREYSVQILEVYPHAQGGRDLLLRITDRELLEKTGGIVRGMSGSPIIQDGRLVGAVTHVLVDNPIRGYGIFIENMLAASEIGEKAA